MIHLTSCDRIGRDGDPTPTIASEMRNRMIKFATNPAERRDGIICIPLNLAEWRVCLAALRIVAEL